MVNLTSVLLLINITSKLHIGKDTDLVLVHGVFRHGERTTKEFYPTDPNLNNDLYPMGLGGLTNNGKMMAYKLGKFLRQTYGNFIGDDYVEDIMEARSTDTARTKMSAQLVLAGLWPPSVLQRWNSELAWQPIPVFSKPKSDEDLINPDNCAFRTFALENMKHNPKVQSMYIEPFQQLIGDIEANAEFPIKSTVDLLDFYNLLRAEVATNWSIPIWTQKIYPEPLYTAASLAYDYLNFVPEVKKINTGYLLQKIVNDTLAKIQGTLNPPRRKMFLYSGHETTIGYMLQALKLLEPHIPQYSSILLFEVHNKTNNYFIKVLYKNSSSAADATLLNIPGCETLCPIDQFIALQNEVLPSYSIEQACDLNNVEL